MPAIGVKPVLFTSVSTVPGAGAKPSVMPSGRPVAVKPGLVTGTSVPALNVAVFGVANV